MHKLWLLSMHLVADRLVWIFGRAGRSNWSKASAGLTDGRTHKAIEIYNTSSNRFSIAMMGKSFFGMIHYYKQT